MVLMVGRGGPGRRLGARGHRGAGRAGNQRRGEPQPSKKLACCDGEDRDARTRARHPHARVRLQVCGHGASGQGALLLPV